MRSNEVPLKIEVFSQDDASDFIILDPKEILSILRDIAVRRSRVALYYNDDNSMVLTLLLAADQSGLLVDASTNSAVNRHIEQSNHNVFVSTHNQAKVQWVSNETTLSLYENSPAFYLPLPHKLLRLQRRDYFRLMTREPDALKCIFHHAPEKNHLSHEVTVMDISIGGLALACEENEVKLQPGLVYPNCEIELPEIGTIIATIEVKNSLEVTTRNGEVKRRAGCVFVKPDGKTTMLLQRYVAQMQLKQPKSQNQ